MRISEYLSVRSESPRSLEDLKQLYGLLGNPQQSLVCIQIAGTNGKGSTSSMLASILKTAGYSVGLYTSPALSRVNERMRINGEEISDELLLSCAEQVEKAEKKLRRSFGGFDRMTAAALIAFRESGVQFAVLETGLGGRKDAVTAVDGTVLTMITSVSMDHMQLLGNTIAEIAWEKSGILKQGVPCIVHPQVREAEEVIKRCAEETGSPLTFIGEDAITDVSIFERGQSFCYRGKPLSVSLIGAHQRTNAAAAYEGALALKRLGYRIGEEAIVKGIALARWPGRLEWVNGCLLDGAHNPDAMRILKNALSDWYPNRKVCVLLSIMRDKDVDGILKELSCFAASAVTMRITPRALDENELAEKIRACGIPAEPASGVEEGLTMLRKHCAETEHSLALIAGSLYLAGAARDLLLKEEQEK